MVGAVYRKGEFNELFNSYGMVLMDECHHCGSATSVELMQKVNARYVYGVSATPKRGDNLEKLIYMLIGPIRHSYTAKERAMAQESATMYIQGIQEWLIPVKIRMILMERIL